MTPRWCQDLGIKVPSLNTKRCCVNLTCIRFTLSVRGLTPSCLGGIREALTIILLGKNKWLKLIPKQEFPMLLLKWMHRLSLFWT